MNRHIEKPLPTLFVSQKDIQKTLLIAKKYLNSDELSLNDDGFYSISDLCSKIKSIDPDLSYINKNHIVELYFKDPERKIFIGINEDEIKYKKVRYVQPPEILFFGTLSKLLDKMNQFGIKSRTKGYIKLYSSPEAAADFARKFMKTPDDNIEVLSINAMEAFTDGLKFSTFKDDEFIVVRVDRKYITGVVQ